MSLGWVYLALLTTWCFYYSGHGLSGMSLLTWLSFIAVPSMFAGAIVTAFSMQATGSLDTYVTAMGDVGLTTSNYSYAE